MSGDLCFFSEITLGKVAILFILFFFLSNVVFYLAPTSLFVGNRPSEPVTVTNDPNELDPSPVRNQKVHIFSISVYF